MLRLSVRGLRRQPELLACGSGVFYGSIGDKSKPDNPVLVVGGGLVGLSAAVFLASRRVPTVLVEKHAGSSPHPRAIGYTPRSLEQYRSAGLGDRIPPAPPGMRLRRLTVTSLAGEWKQETAWTPPATGAKPALITDFSPCSGAAIAQDRLEPILRQRASELGADMRLKTEFLGFEQDDGGVTARLRPRGGAEETLRASYLVAADGSHSRIRDALKIGRSGRGHMQTTRSVLFRAPLDEYLKRGVHQFNIDQGDFKAFLTTYNDGRWVLMFSDDVERDPATLLTLVRRAIGREDIPVEIITTGRWELGAFIADTFNDGRIFLAGDSAHQLPPNRGGFGANTGIDDAHNLAWKLEAVLKGQSSPSLLATYDAERRPIAWLRHDQIFARDDYQAHAGELKGKVKILDDIGMELGQLYRSGAVIGPTVDLPPAKRPDEWRGQPGTRAPHVWITRGTGGTRVSTLDMLQQQWVLLAADATWRALAATASAALGVPVDVAVLGDDIRAAGTDQDELARAFGLAKGGASLVRPDGYIAWRSAESPAEPEAALTSALARVAFPLNA